MRRLILPTLKYLLFLAEEIFSPRKEGGMLISSLSTVKLARFVILIKVGVKIFLRRKGQLDVITFKRARNVMQKNKILT